MTSRSWPRAPGAALTASSAGARTAGAACRAARRRNGGRRCARPSRSWPREFTRCTSVRRRATSTTRGQSATPTVRSWRRLTASHTGWRRGRVRHTMALRSRVARAHSRSSRWSAARSGSSRRARGSSTTSAAWSRSRCCAMRRARSSSPARTASRWRETSSRDWRLRGAAIRESGRGATSTSSWVNLRSASSRGSPVRSQPRAPSRRTIP